METGIIVAIFGFSVSNAILILKEDQWALVHIQDIVYDISYANQAIKEADLGTLLPDEELLCEIHRILSSWNIERKLF